MAKSYLDKMRDIVKKAEEAQQKISKIEAVGNEIVNLIGEAYEACGEADVDSRIDEFQHQIKCMIAEKKKHGNAEESTPKAEQMQAAISQIR